MTHPSWRRVTPAARCPVCGKPDWCAVSRDGAAALCQRVESAKRVRDAGWLHHLRDDNWKRTDRTVRSVPLTTTVSPVPAAFGRLAEEYRAAVDPERLYNHAAALGLSANSLRYLAIGWSAEHRAWSFPMTRAAGAVSGIRLRRESGAKFAVRGSKEGLFVAATDWSAAAGRLLVSEGPTDTAALVDMGFTAVAGRPSCTGGIGPLVELVRQRKPNEVVVVADGDEPGQRGATNLASVLVAYVPAVRVVAPPEGIKDIRAWRRAGAGREDLERLISAAEVRQLVVRARPGCGQKGSVPR